jgi:hypothetical protein
VDMRSFSRMMISPVKVCSGAASVLAKL